MDDLFVKITEKTTGRALAQNLHLNAPQEALCLEKNGHIIDIDTEITPEDKVRFISFDSEEGKEVFWHSSAHILAQAVLRLFPEAIPTIGPAIEQGFYYDFANLSLSEHDLEKIEKEMEKISQENYKPVRHLFSSKEEALTHFKNNRFKKELIDSFGENDSITGYLQGDFFDLCRGPHISNLGKVKALKLLKVSGAYWRGDKENPMLTRIYGISFPEKKQLKEYLFQIEEAKKRDHKVLGPKLSLFSLKEEAPGMPFIHGKGLIVWNGLLSFIRSLLDKHNYEEIKTPTLMSRELWERSGHWKNYRQNMFTSEIEERDFAIKPMNCPGCILYYSGTRHSYREFPLRIAEIGNVHRYEASGALSGLFRVRSFHQDDAHIFMRPQDIEEEILNVLNLADEIYQTFGLSYHLELSTRPEKDTIGSDEEWETATKGLQGALDRSLKPYKINPGDGAFYGPKIDFHIKDALKRTWQCGTIQLDMSLPERFDLTYDDADGTQKRPVMIHRAIFGSVERFLGILIEHFAGRFPLWLSPRQIRILPVADRHVEEAEKLKTQLKKEGFHVDIDDSHESVSKKVRLAQIEQVNYILTIGDKELEEGTLSLRTRQGAIFQGLSYEKFLQTLLEEFRCKSLESLFL